MTPATAVAEREDAPQKSFIEAIHDTLPTKCAPMTASSFSAKTSGGAAESFG